MKLTRTSKLTLVVVLTIWFLTGATAFHMARLHAEDKKADTDIYQSLRLFNEVLFKLKQNYVTDLDNNKLMKAAINGMLQEVDPHTTYFTPEEFADFTSNTKGEFGGLGIQIDKKGDYITVVSPIEGTPAYKMGIMAGDKLVKVDGVSVVAVSTDEAIKKMRGPKGTHVKITIERPGVKEPLVFDITRDIIKIKSIPYAFKLDNGIGYIRINQFNANTTQELRQNLDRLEEQGIRGLLIDLRYNPGGLLNEAIDTVNEFIGKGKLVVSTKGRIPTSNSEYFTMYDRQRSGYPVIVMINEASASAAEIFAGSMQDWDKALVVGKTSFGKGSVQQLLPLSDGGGIKVTTSKYYIKSGRCIHKEINDKILRGKEVTDNEKKEIEANAHKEVYKTVKGRTVYGGGGITPDVEIDSPLLTKFGVELRRNNTFFNYAIEYMVKHGHKVSRNFKVDDSVMSDFLNYAKAQKIEYNQADLDSTRDFIKVSLASEIISKQYGEDEAYKVGMQLDKQLEDTLLIFDRCKTLDDMFNYAAQQQQRKNANKR